MFNVKQLKMNKFIKYIRQLIIGNSDATLEIASFPPACWFKKFTCKKFLFFIHL